MRKTSKNKSSAIKVASIKNIRENSEAFKSYNEYKKIAQLAEQVDIALGRKTNFVSETHSTVNFEIKLYGNSQNTSY